MSFYDLMQSCKDFDIEQFCAGITPEDVQSILAKDNLTEYDFLALLSDAADPFLEEIAQKAAVLTRKYFGKTVKIFTPLYISNYCQNKCAYCSFAKQHHINRRHLNLNEIRAEAEKISSSGIRHILLLTGEAPSLVTLQYIKDAVKILREYFSSVAIEIYPLTSEAYAELVEEGVDGLTIYQETYNQSLYKELHSGGPKENYRFRLEAPERASAQGIRAVTVGALFGLYNWRSEAFFTALHVSFLQKKFPSVELCLSFPRLRPLAGEFNTSHLVNDRQFVRMMVAARLFLPFAGITVSTRESENFRRAIIPMGVTKISAGVSTAVGGHIGDESTSQFEIADPRTLEQIKADLHRMGYQPVMHDWSNRFDIQDF